MVESVPELDVAVTCNGAYCVSFKYYGVVIPPVRVS